MAATGFTPISLYYSSTTGTSPTAGNLVAGELALNTFDGKLFYKDSAGVVQVIATKGTGTIGGSNTQVQYNSSGAFAGSANMTFNGTGLTLANDASISGLTVGKGGGAVSTNTAFGLTALNTNSTGVGATAIGYQALLASTGSYSTAIGYNTGRFVSSGQVTALGAFALYNNTTGTANTGLGGNNGVVEGALQSNTTGSYNIAVGTGALYSNSTASNNTAVGYQAGYSKTTGDSNSFFGRQAGYAVTTGIRNTAIGANAMDTGTGGNYNTAVGWNSLANDTADYNTAVGYVSLQTNTTGSQITSVGAYALNKNTTGAYNTAVGVNASVENTTGSYNTSVGHSALNSTTTASNNTAVGYQAGYSNTTGPQNTFIGQQAGYNTNNATGYNTFVGRTSGYSNTTGYNNTFVGGDSGYYVSSGTKNTILGMYTGNQGGLDIRTASNYIVLSDGDGNPRCYWRDDGKMFTTASITDSEAVSIKNPNATRPYGATIVFSGATPNNTTQYFLNGEDSTNAKFFIYSSGTISNRTGTYNTISDAKIKQDVTDATSQWDDIKAIRFRKYRLIDDVKVNPDAPYLMGVVAQELQQTSPNLIDECVDKEGEVTLGVKQSIIFMKATKALQEAMERIETLEAKVLALEAK